MAWAISGLLACGRQSQPPPETAYRKVREALQRGELLPALNEADFALRRYEKDGHTDWAYRFRVLKAEVLMYRGQSKESLGLLEPEVPGSLAFDETAIRRSMVQGLANTYLQQFEPAEIHLREAEQLSKQRRHPDLLGEIALYRGVLALVRGALPQAELSFRHALLLAREQKQPFQEANALNNLGLVYMRRQQFGEAIDWFNASHELAGRLGYRMLDSKLSGNLGWCHFKLGDYETALALFTEAETLATQSGLDKDRLIWLTNIGSVHYEQQEFAEAEQEYKRALEIARKLDNKASMAVCLNNLAATALESGHYAVAEQYNREAFQLKRAIGDMSSELYSALNEARISAGRHDYRSAVDLFQRIIRESGNDVSLRWEAEADLAAGYAQQGKPALAETQFRRAIATVDAARAALVKEEHRLSFLATATRFYDDYIDFLISRGAPREALQVAEHSRARTLQEGLGLKNIAANAFRPEQAARKSGGVILSYWLKPGRSYLWAITPSKVTLFDLPADAEISSEVESYRKALVGPRDVLETANPHGQNLYRTLVAPAQKLIPSGTHVTIIADGALHGLNFETLLAPEPHLHYWIEDVVVANANSIALVANSQPNPRSHTGQLLLIGNAVSPNGEFPSLAQAQLEVERVQEHFPAERRVVVTGDRATPRAYSQNEPRRFEYIHFVAHGTASRTTPLDSGIILSRDGDAYKLYAHDIMQQPLRAQLVTISACYGAGTRAYSGEGLIGLSWAFLRAGAHHVIAALWEVNDTSTPQLMDDLYRRLIQGQDPAAALRSAKLAMLHSDSIFRRPFYWAAFQLYTGS